MVFLNYKALPKLKGDHEGVSNGCAQGKNVKNPFPKRDSKAEGVLELIHSEMCVAQCHHPPIMGMYTMYHSLMIILVKDLDIFEVFNKIKEFKALIREPLCKED
jgi:hypothetical protein